MNLKEKSLRGLIWSAAQSWGGQVVTLFVFALLARLLDPAAFGLIAMANVFIAFTKVFIDQGFAMAIIQRRDLEPEHLNTAFWTNFSIGVLLTCVGMLIAGSIARLYGEPDLAPIVRWMSILFLVSSLTAVQQALLQRELEFRTLAIRSLISIVIGGVVGTTMALLGYGVWSLVGQQLATGIVNVALLWGVSKWRPAFSVSAKHFRDLFSYGINVIGINLTEFLSRNADKFLIGFYLGPTLLGYYTVAYRFLESLTRLFSSVTYQVTFSSFSAIQSNIPRLRSAFYSATQLTSLITFPMFAGLIALAPYVVFLLFGNQWASSIPVVQILALVGILESVFLFNANVMLAMGKPSWRFKLNLLNALVNLIGFVIAVRWGIVAVAAAYVIRAYLLSPLPLLLVRRLIDIDIRKYFANYRGPVLSTVVMVIVVMLATPYLSPHLPLSWFVAVAVLIGILAYFSAAAFLSPAILRHARESIRSYAAQRGAEH